MSALLPLALKLSVAALILAIGMGSRPADLLYLWRRPGLLLRSLLAMYLLVPLAAVGLVRLLPMTPGLKAALLVLAVSAGAPLLPRKLGTLDSGAYVFSLLVLSSLLAIVAVPAWVGLLARYFGVETELAPLTVALLMAKAFLLPLGLGLGLSALFPRWAPRVAGRLMALAGALLAFSALLLALHLEVFAALRWEGGAAVATMLALALAIGHLCGGPLPDDRTALAFACATRHVGIAVLVAGAFPGPRTLVLMTGYLLASAAVCLPYLHWRRRVRQRA